MPKSLVANGAVLFRWTFASAAASECRSAFTLYEYKKKTIFRSTCVCAYACAVCVLTTVCLRYACEKRGNTNHFGHSAVRVWICSSRTNDSLFTWASHFTAE